MANRPGAPDENVHVTFENVEVGYRNFRGIKSDFNANGDREFVVFLPFEVANEMAQAGWNIKQTNPREEGDEIRYYLPVKVDLHSEIRPSNIQIVGSKSRTRVDDSTVDMLDFMEFTNVDVIVRPYNWELKTGKQGTKAYLVEMFGTIRENPLELKYAHIPIAGQTPGEQ